MWHIPVESLTDCGLLRPLEFEYKIFNIMAIS